MDVNIPLDVKTYIEKNPSKFKNLPITIRSIENFIDTYKPSSHLDIEKKRCQFNVKFKN